MSRVLVADDQEDVRRLLSLTLELEGYEVGTALDGAEVVAQASNERPDAIVMDVMMPEIDGFKLPVPFAKWKRRGAATFISSR